MDINLIISEFFNLGLIFVIIILLISNNNWSRDASQCKDELWQCKIDNVELKVELQFVEGGKNE